MLKNIAIKRITGLVMSAILCVSASGCGKSNDIVVDDYGAEKVEAVTGDTDIGTATDSVTVSTNSEKTLRELFGRSVSFDKDFKIDDVDFKCMAYFSIPDQEYLNAYNMRKIDDGKSVENAIVKNFLGDTAHKLETIKYENSTDYYPLLYKYEDIMAKHESAKKRMEQGGSFYPQGEYDDILITSSSGEIYEWRDDKDIYIHMYEGDHDGIKFVMLLAYDYVVGTREIYIVPKSIKEYFPGYDFKTVIVSGTNNLSGQPINMSNNCTTQIDEIKEDALSLLNKELLLDIDSVTNDAKGYFNSVGDDGVLFYGSPANLSYLSNEVQFEPGDSVLMFSDVDYISTFKSGGIKGLAIDYELVAEQRSLLEEHLSTHFGSELHDFDLVSSPNFNDIIDPANFTTDGYAIYIESGTSAEDASEDETSIKLNMSNYGIIKYTSNGFYGLDIAMSEEVVDTIENVKLLESDKIFESLKQGIRDNVDFDKLENSKELYIGNLALMYYPYKESEDSDTYMMIPVWQFIVSASNLPLGMEIFINAMDGSVVDVFYYNYNDVVSD